MYVCVTTNAYIFFLVFGFGLLPAPSTETSPKHSRPDSFKVHIHRHGHVRVFPAQVVHVQVI
ncbi:unnamed protein product [Sphacelaria rigidula]